MNYLILFLMPLAWAATDVSRCQRIPTQHLRSDCEAMVRSGKYPKELFKVCEGVTGDLEFANCLDGSKGHTLSRPALKICAGMEQQAQKLECLDEIKIRTYSEGQLEECAALGEALDRLKCVSETGKRVVAPRQRHVAPKPSPVPKPPAVKPKATTPSP